MSHACFFVVLATLTSLSLPPTAKSANVMVDGVTYDSEAQRRQALKGDAQAQYILALGCSSRAAGPTLHEALQRLPPDLPEHLPEEMRVRLELEAQSDMTWVVVSDPIPAGGSILGTGLGRDSQLATRGEKSEGWVWPAFEERRYDSFRAYYRLVPKGRFAVEYTVRLNNPGRFELPETRVEAQYTP